MIIVLAVASRWLADASTLFYAATLALLFIDALQPRRPLHRAALVLLFVVLVAQTGLLWVRFEELDNLPVYSPADALRLAAWLVVAAALSVNAWFPTDLTLFFINVVGFAWVVFSNFSASAAVDGVGHGGDLLFLHVMLAVGSYVAFAFGFVFSFLYLVHDAMLRAGRWGSWYFRLPSLERLDTLAFRCAAVGVPLLLAAIVSGMLWGHMRFGRWLWWDPKPIVTMLIWLAYGVYVLLRMRSGWGGRNLAWVNVLCFGGVIVNFVAISSLSGFHRAV
ncbi:MAG: cytochrome c biogenesis protein CcsA [Thermoflavifilum sp.]|nr:cytochrome c biogenesis protein CcsA [Thermoflavifilum sp.]MCL6514487.1 cytochrome c biogenesis protein [Alicyclobacillus sp.]